MRADPASSRRDQLDIDNPPRGVGGVKQTADVSTVAGHDVRPDLSCRGGHHGIYHITKTCAAEQSPGGVGSLLSQAHHLTTSQQPAELDLRGRPADLNDDRGGNHGDDACLQPYSVLCPYAAAVAVRRNQDGSIVNHWRHADRCSGPRRPMRRRAASSSSRVSAPCSASHSATAIRPSRSLRACLAAAVIQADTLTPSASAAATTRAWTSGSTVMASLGEGLPRGMKKVYYRSGRIERHQRNDVSGLLPDSE
jgi:hypothetical protein